MLALSAGWSAVLVKVLQGAGGFGLPVRPADPDGALAWAGRLFRTAPTASDGGRSVHRPGGATPLMRPVVTILEVMGALGLRLRAEAAR